MDERNINPGFPTDDNDYNQDQLNYSPIINTTPYYIETFARATQTFNVSVDQFAETAKLIREYFNESVNKSRNPYIEAAAKAQIVSNYAGAFGNMVNEERMEEDLRELLQSKYAESVPIMRRLLMSGGNLSPDDLANSPSQGIPTREEFIRQEFDRASRFDKEIFFNQLSPSGMLTQGSMFAISWPLQFALFEPITQPFGIVKQINDTIGNVLFGFTGLDYSLQTISKIFQTSPLQRYESIYQTELLLSSSLGGKLNADVATETALKMAREYPLEATDILQAIRSLSVYPEVKPFIGNEDYQRKLINVVSGLSLINPEQGVHGALFSIVEALSGSFRSLQMRFNISPEIIAREAHMSLGEMKSSPDKLIEGLERFIQNTVGLDVINAQKYSFTKQIGNIDDALNLFTKNIFEVSGTYQNLSKASTAFASGVSSILENPAIFDTFGNMFLNKFNDRLNAAFAQFLGVSKDTYTQMTPAEIANLTESTFANLPKDELKNRVRELIKNLAEIQTDIRKDIDDVLSDTFGITISDIGTKISSMIANQIKNIITGLIKGIVESLNPINLLSNLPDILETFVGMSLIPALGQMFTKTVYGSRYKHHLDEAINKARQDLEEIRHQTSRGDEGDKGTSRLPEPRGPQGPQTPTRYSGETAPTHSQGGQPIENQNQTETIRQQAQRPQQVILQNDIRAGYVNPRINTALNDQAPEQYNTLIGRNITTEYRELNTAQRSGFPTEAFNLVPFISSGYIYLNKPMESPDILFKTLSGNITQKELAEFYKDLNLNRSLFESRQSINLTPLQSSILAGLSKAELMTFTPSKTGAKFSQIVDSIFNESNKSPIAVAIRQKYTELTDDFILEQLQEIYSRIRAGTADNYQLMQAELLRKEMLRRYTTYQGEQKDVLGKKITELNFSTARPIDQLNISDIVGYSNVEYQRNAGDNREEIPRLKQEMAYQINPIGVSPLARYIFDMPINRGSLRSIIAFSELFQEAPIKTVRAFVENNRERINQLAEKYLQYASTVSRGGVLTQEQAIEFKAIGDILNRVMSAVPDINDQIFDILSKDDRVRNILFENRNDRLKVLKYGNLTADTFINAIGTTGNRVLDEQGRINPYRLFYDIQGADSGKIAEILSVIDASQEKKLLGFTTKQIEQERLRYNLKQYREIIEQIHGKENLENVMASITSNLESDDLKQKLQSLSYIGILENLRNQVQNLPEQQRGAALNQLASQFREEEIMKTIQAYDKYAQLQRELNALEGNETNEAKTRREEIQNQIKTQKSIINSPYKLFDIKEFEKNLRQNDLNLGIQQEESLEDFINRTGLSLEQLYHQVNAIQSATEEERSKIISQANIQNRQTILSNALTPLIGVLNSGDEKLIEYYRKQAAKTLGLQEDAKEEDIFKAAGININRFRDELTGKYRTEQLQQTLTQMPKYEEYFNRIANLLEHSGQNDNIRRQILQELNRQIIEISTEVKAGRKTYEEGVEQLRTLSEVIINNPRLTQVLKENELNKISSVITATEENINKFIERQQKKLVNAPQSENEILQNQINRIAQETGVVIPQSDQFTRHKAIFADKPLIFNTIDTIETATRNLKNLGLTGVFDIAANSAMTAFTADMALGLIPGGDKIKERIQETLLGIDPISAIFLGSTVFQLFKNVFSGGSGRLANIVNKITPTRVIGAAVLGYGLFDIYNQYKNAKNINAQLADLVSQNVNVDDINKSQFASMLKGAGIATMGAAGIAATLGPEAQIPAAIIGAVGAGITAIGSYFENKNEESQEKIKEKYSLIQASQNLEKQIEVGQIRPDEGLRELLPIYSKLYKPEIIEQKYNTLISNLSNSGIIDSYKSEALYKEYSPENISTFFTYYNKLSELNKSANKNISKISLSEISSIQTDIEASNLPSEQKAQLINQIAELYRKKISDMDSGDVKNLQQNLQNIYSTAVGQSFFAENKDEANAQSNIASTIKQSAALKEVKLDNTITISSSQLNTKNADKLITQLQGARELAIKLGDEKEVKVIDDLLSKIEQAKKDPNSVVKVNVDDLQKAKAFIEQNFVKPDMAKTFIGQIDEQFKMAQQSAQVGNLAGAQYFSNYAVSEIDKELQKIDYTLKYDKSLTDKDRNELKTYGAQLFKERQEIQNYINRGYAEDDAINSKIDERGVREAREAISALKELPGGQQLAVDEAKKFMMLARGFGLTDEKIIELGRKLGFSARDLLYAGMPYNTFKNIADRKMFQIFLDSSKTSGSTADNSAAPQKLPATQPQLPQPQTNPVNNNPTQQQQHQPQPPQQQHQQQNQQASTNSISVQNLSVATLYAGKIISSG